jgi:hypothetical protein
MSTKIKFSSGEEKELLEGTFISQMNCGSSKTTFSAK